MSIDAQEKVYRLPVSDALAIDVLAYLAFRLNSKNGDCHPSRDRIARDLRLSGEIVRQKLRWLEANGYLKTERGGGRGKANFYVLILDGKGATMLPLSGAQKGQRQLRKGATTLPPTRKNPKNTARARRSPHGKQPRSAP